jgi:GNAT superfamily N-acetyltransferase
MSEQRESAFPPESSVAGPATMRRATAEDLPAIVRLLADDPLGAKRERYSLPLPPAYAQAFAAIDRDPTQALYVACVDGAVVGVLQMTFIPYLTYQGGWRALIEGVRIAPALRSRGLGRAVFEWAIERARARGCHMVQLTSDKSRPDAIRFYEALGFVASHEGLKLFLAPGGAPQTQDG